MNRIPDSRLKDKLSNRANTNSPTKQTAIAIALLTIDRQVVGSCRIVCAVFRYKRQGANGNILPLQEYGRAVLSCQIDDGSSCRELFKYNPSAVFEAVETGKVIVGQVDNDRSCSGYTEVALPALGAGGSLCG